MKPTPTQLAVLRRLAMIDCEATFTQALHGVPRVRYATLRACVDRGWVASLPHDLYAWYVLTDAGRAEVLEAADGGDGA